MTTTTYVLTPSQRQRIENGAQLLDRKLGFDWAMKVDPERLHMNSCFSCVLGQIFGSYSLGENRLELTTIAAQQYGFMPTEEDLYPTYITNTQARNAYWGELVRRRQVQITNATDKGDFQS